MINTIRELNAKARAHEARREVWTNETPQFQTTHLLKPLTEFTNKEEKTMPEIKEVPFLKGDQIQKGETMTVTFLAPHEEVSKEESGLENDIAQVLVELETGEKRVWTMNRTCQRMIATLHGTNSDAWVGKKVKLYSLEQNVRGQMKQVIYVKGERVEA